MTKWISCLFCGIYNLILVIDRNDMDYNPEDPRVDSTFRSPHAELNELPNDLNNTIWHSTSDSTLYSFTGLIITYLNILF